MSTVLLKRVITTIPVFIGITALVFLLVRLVPGDVVDVMLRDATSQSPEYADYLRGLYGLDQPILQQYLDWVGHMARGNLGTSLRLGTPVTQEIMLRLPVTLQLTITSMIISVCLAVPLGVISAIKQDTIVDNIARLLALIGLSVPNFWLGTIIVLVLSLYVPALVPSGYVSFFKDPFVNLKSMIPAGFVLGTYMMGVVARMTRSAVLEVLRQEYVLAGRSKGLSEKVLIIRHVLKNALNPVVTIIGIQIGFLLGGTVIIENVFVLPGVGSLLLQGITQRDYPIVQGVVLLIAFMYVTVNFFVDVVYTYLDPRIRYQ